MTSCPASARARATILAPRSWPSRPALATTIRSLRVTGGDTFQYYRNLGGNVSGYRAVAVAGENAPRAPVLAYNYRVTLGLGSPPAAAGSLSIENPATGTTLARVPAAGASDVAAAVARARAAQPAWEALGVRERGRALRRLARAVR